MTRRLVFMLHCSMASEPECQGETHVLGPGGADKRLVGRGFRVAFQSCFTCAGEFASAMVSSFWMP